MEVETQTLPNFDLKPKLPFSYGHNIPLDSHEPPRFDGESESPVSGDLKCEDFDIPAESPVSGELKCEDFEIPESLDESSTATADECKRFDVESESPVSGDVKCEDVEIPARESSAGIAPARCAVKLQKMYRGHRTRRRLADSAIVAEELWWQALDYARLNHSTISFFNFSKPETVSSRWNRVKLNASKVGQGLSKDGEAQKLAFQHWIEAIDPQHRYGHSLHLYYEEWAKADSGQPFFYWLDIGDGKEVDLKDCPRSKLRKQCIKYLGPQERVHYEYTFLEGKLVHKQTGNLLDTNKGPKGAKWIFVMSTFKKLYAGEKKKGVFHHSSFLAGGATLAAGRLVADNGVLTSISAYSGHYRPTDERLNSFLSYLSSNGINLDEVQIHNPKDDYDSYSDNKTDLQKSDSINKDEISPLPLQATEEIKSAAKNEYKRTLSGGLHSPRADVPKNSILQRINSKKAASSYQLGHQLSLKWSTGVGPRIGCVADYPLELRQQALEFVNLSPRASHAPPSPYGRIGGFGTPRSHFTPDISNGDMISGN